jgi:hypothetical protein
MDRKINTNIFYSAFNVFVSAFAGYYEVVSDPIDMLRIQQKLRTDEYADIVSHDADLDKQITDSRASCNTFLPSGQF